jgi:hypothetical protein
LSRADEFNFLIDSIDFKKLDKDELLKIYLKNKWLGNNKTCKFFILN